MVERKWREGGQNARRGRVRSIPERSIALIGAPVGRKLRLLNFFWFDVTNGYLSVPKEFSGKP